MPLIPLFNDGQQVPQAQIGPAPQGQRQRVIMDLNAATANFATPLLPMELADRSGYDRLGQAFGNASDLLGGLALKKAEAVNIRRVGEGQAQMQQQLAEFDAWKQKNPDETTWEGEWASRLETMRESVFGENLSPAARETLQTSYQQFAAQSKIGLTTEVTKVSFRKAAETQLGLAATAFERGDPATADAHLKKAADAGYLSREDARRSSAAGHAQVKMRSLENLGTEVNGAMEVNNLDKAKQLVTANPYLSEQEKGTQITSLTHRFELKQTHDQLYALATDQPHLAPAQLRASLDQKKLSGPDYANLTQFAERRLQEKRAESVQTLRTLIDQRDPAYAKGLKDNPFLREKDREDLQRYAWEPLSTDPVQASQIYTLAASLEQREGSPEYTLIKEQVLMSLSGEMKEKALAKLNAGSQKPQPPAIARTVQNIYQQSHQDLANGHYGALHGPLASIRTELPPKIRMEVDAIKSSLNIGLEDRLTKEPDLVKTQELDARRLWWENQPNKGYNFKSFMVDDLAAQHRAASQKQKVIAEFEDWLGAHPKASLQEVNATYVNLAVKYKSHSDGEAASTEIRRIDEGILKTRKIIQQHASH
ncbi:hypothetical protein [Prosthecobacter dejongeii]|uniref:Uncharacterized protein n=1 Tax=Prosthecobacter dejongeii TaxID=48465 RepID=A0A7W7YR09_9BACT|nr:hypothetical protein [Prosthecobacter dejongeii]MBB5040587.1 hypothetical protein [Prosthecobacter dejongeii]